MYSKGNYITIIFLILCIPAIGTCEPLPFDSYVEEFLKCLSSVSSMHIIENEDGRYRSLYSKLYKDNMMRVGIFLGAMDTPQKTCIDRPAKHAITLYLTRECQSNSFACGFTIKSEEPTVLYKTLGSRRIIIGIHDSSVSEDLKRNITEMASAQREKSMKVTESFLRSIQEDNVVFYVGHSRYGTGPGFYHLPFLSAQWFSTYIGSPLLPTLLHKLSEPSSAEVLGLFGCSSQRYYARDIHTVSPQTALVVSTRITNYDSCIADAIGVLNLIISETSYEGFNEALKSSNHKFYGLFKENTFPIFRRHNSIVSISIFILSIPIFLICFSIFSDRVPSPFVIRSFPKGFILLLLSLAYSLIIIKYISKYSPWVYDESIPLFFLLAGLFMLVILLYKKQITLRDAFSIPWSSLLHFVALSLIYIFLTINGSFELSQISISIIQAVKVFALFLLFSPYIIITNGIIEYPLTPKFKKHPILRIALFIFASGLLSFMITISLAIFSSYLIPYIRIIFSLFFYMQIISMFLYLYKYSTVLPNLLQSLTLAVVFSENIHGLF